MENSKYYHVFWKTFLINRWTMFYFIHFSIHLSWMIENIVEFFQIIRHLPFSQVVLRWWNQSKRDCRKLCACHIGWAVKSSTEWMRSRYIVPFTGMSFGNFCLNALQRRCVWAMASVQCETIQIDLLALNCFLEYVIWNSPQWNVIRCLTLQHILSWLFSSLMNV